MPNFEQILDHHHYCFHKPRQCLFVYANKLELASNMEEVTLLYLLVLGGIMVLVAVMTLVNIITIV